MSIAISPTTSAASVGLSGMRAAQLRLDVSAHNVAIVQTPGFQRQQTAQPANGGVTAQMGQEPSSLAQGTGGLNRLADAIVEQRTSLYSFAADLRTVQTQHAMLGSLLDVQA